MTSSDLDFLIRLHTESPYEGPVEDIADVEEFDGVNKSDFVRSLISVSKDIREVIAYLEHSKVADGKPTQLLRLCARDIVNIGIEQDKFNHESHHQLSEIEVIKQGITSFEQQVIANAKILASLEQKIDQLASTQMPPLPAHMTRSYANVVSTSPSPQEEEHAVIVEGSKGFDNIKIRSEIRNYAKKVNLIQPKDMVLSGTRKLILKTNTLQEAKTILQSLQECYSIQERSQLRLSKQRKHRLILYSVPTDISEEYLKTEIENLDCIQGHTVEIIRKIPLREEMFHWIIEVDSFTRLALLNLSRLCIDYACIRVTDFVNISRCYKCQRLGHIAPTCRNEPICGKCAGRHGTNMCTSTEIRCVNCVDSDNHTSDSPYCPTFREYKRNKIAGSRSPVQR